MRQPGRSGCRSAGAETHIVSRSTLQDRIIDRFDAHDARGTAMSHDHCPGAETDFQPHRPGIQPTGLLSCGRRAFTVQADRLGGGGGAISTEERVLRNFLRTKPLLWVQEGALFCLWGPYN